jgi:hypothetical protein
VSHRIAVSPQGILGLIATPNEPGSPIESNDIPPEVIDSFDESAIYGLVSPPSVDTTLPIPNAGPPSGHLTRR